MDGRIRLALCFVALWVGAGAVTPELGLAAFPGGNGRLVFTSSGSGGGPEVHTIWPDGTAESNLTPGEYDHVPGWSRDGSRIVFQNMDLTAEVMNTDGSARSVIPGFGSEGAHWTPSGRIVIATSRRQDEEAEEVYNDIATVNPDGSDLELIYTIGYYDGVLRNPVMSQDGTRVAFEYDPDALTEPDVTTSDIYVINSNGTGLQNVTNSPAANDLDPDWSPDGRKLVFWKTGGAFTINPDGSGLTPVPNGANASGPVFSPDGRRLAFSRDRDIFTMNLDGSDLFNVTNDAAARRDEAPDWQSRINEPYPRPGGATPLRVPLVNAYEQCLAPNSDHVAPLALPSCTPPVARSSLLTTSTIGQGGGSLRLTVFCNGGAPAEVPPCNATPGDQVDVAITSTATDVSTSAGADYTGSLLLALGLRITDKGSGAQDLDPATVQDLEAGTPLACLPTATSDGSSCSTSTTLDAILPGIARERERAVVSIRTAELRDAGADETLAGGPATCPPSCGTGDERTFLEQGVFAP